VRNPPSDIGPAELIERLGGPKETIILDVRSAWEYRRGHLPGARRTPLWKALLASTAASLRGSTEIVAYCDLGPRAWLARAFLERRGIGVRLLRGHMSRWRRRRLPLADK